MKYLFTYFIVLGALFHLGAGVGYILFPEKVAETYQKAKLKISQKVYAEISQFRAEEPGDQAVDPIIFNFKAWAPQENSHTVKPGQVMIGAMLFSDLADALKALKNGDTMLLGAGVYKHGMSITKDNISLSGVGHVVFDGVALEGKAAIVTKGDNTQISNIECRNIAVRDRNGACVRHEGYGLSLNNVYFHDSESGLLSGKKKKLDIVSINNSRLESLGNAGSAHAVYVNSGHLSINNTLVLSARREGHEIKSRAAKTTIINSVIASLNGDDSRLIDVPNGGELLILNSILEQGPKSENMDAIGFGLEGVTHSINSITLEKNVLILERPGGNRLLHISPAIPKPVLINNILISSDESLADEGNYSFKDRAEVGMKLYPYIPPISN